MNFGVVGAQSPTIFQQASAPSNVGAFESGGTQLYPVPQVDDLWVDTINHQLKQCTSVNPYTWAIISGGVPPTRVVPTDSGDHKNFTLPNAPNLLLLHLNGVLIRGAGIDYTLVGITITLNNAITVGVDELDAVVF